MNEYSQMDLWTEEQVANFKEEANDPQFFESLGQPSIGHLVAEGDSWFDYSPVHTAF